MSTIITYGTFDLFHLGHVRLLHRLAQLGDNLIVACSTDEFNSLKGKKSVMKFQHRVEILRSCRYVTKVIPENTWDQKRQDILSENVEILGMGDDWLGKFDDLKDICDVVYLPRTKHISTTLLRMEVLKLQQSIEL